MANVVPQVSTFKYTVKKSFRKLEQKLHDYGNMLHVYQPFNAVIPQLFEFEVHNKIHYEDTTY